MKQIALICSFIFLSQFAFGQSPLPSPVPGGPPVGKKTGPKNKKKPKKNSVPAPVASPNPTPAATPAPKKVSETPGPQSHYQYGAYLSPTWVSSTLTLNSTGTQFQLSGFTPVNPTLYGQYFWENQLSLYANVAYQSFSINSGNVGNFSVVSSKTSYVSAELLISKCFTLSDSSMLCPRVGANYGANYILEFQSNTSLDLTKVSDLLFDIGVIYEMPLNKKGLKLGLGADYQPGTGIGQTSQTIIQSISNYHVQVETVIPLSGPTFNLLAGVTLDLHKGVFSITQDQWNQNLTTIAGVVGIQVNSK